MSDQPTRPEQFPVTPGYTRPPALDTLLSPDDLVYEESSESNGHRINFRVYESIGPLIYNEWAMSKPPRWLKWLSNWAPFGRLFRPLFRLGVLVPYFDRGAYGHTPKWLSYLIHWRPLPGFAYWLWRKLGKPGYLDRIDFKRQTMADRIEVSIEETQIENDNGNLQDGVVATCSRCDHETESYGTGERSRKRCLVLMRNECPMNEENYYVDDDA